MAGKFNVNIKGGSGSVFMGDNAVVNVTTTRNVTTTNSPNRATGNRATLQETSHPVPFQETHTDGKDSPLLKYTISRGFGLIIHNKYFKNMSDRTGSERDFRAIKHFCGNAGICVNETNRKTDDLTAKEIDDLCTEMSKRDFSRNDAFICFILSHGTESGIYGINDDIVSIDKIATMFKSCPSLVGKPKLFFIQACRGKNQDFGLEADKPLDTVVVPPLRLPTGSDTVIAYSCVEGYESYRAVDEGSWFIQQLMNELKDHAHEMHLMDILTRVNRNVADLFVETPSGKKQVPCQLTTLTKFVYFNYPPPLSTASK